MILKYLAIDFFGFKFIQFPQFMPDFHFKNFQIGLYATYVKIKTLDSSDVIKDSLMNMV